MPQHKPIDATATRFLSDPEVAARVLAHMEEKTTDVGADVWREPVANYLSPERFERERAVIRRWPVAFCPSAALPEAGSYVARESGGTPLLVVRDKDGRVRAFKNACRHRGTQLVEGEGCARAFMCRYHGWTYRLDGSLSHVPHEEGFPDLDKEKSGLVPVTCEERLGLVFVTQEPDAPGAAGIDRVTAGVPELLGSEQRLLRSSQSELDVNWKVHLEGSIEGYHIRTTHPESFYPYGFDNLNVVETCGPNSRVTYPFRRIAKLADVAPGQRRVEGLLTYVYHLFPNALVTVLSRHTNLVVIDPVAPDRTRVVSYALANRGEDPDAAAAKRDAEFVGNTGVTEDLAVVLSIQRSIKSGANQFFRFGRFEAAIGHFHRTLAEALGSAAGNGGEGDRHGG